MSEPASATKRGYGLFALLLTLGVMTTAACSRREKFPEYSPHENLLSIVAEFQLIAARDHYRQPMEQDLTGVSIARSTLVRLANYEALHPGRLVPEVLTAKARSLELLGDYESARRNYLEAADYDTELAEDNVRRAGVLDLFLIATKDSMPVSTVEDRITQLTTRAANFRNIARNTDDAHYRSLALRDAETAEVERAETMILNRMVLADGENQALGALEGLISAHVDSSRAMEHALRLARYHKDLALEEIRIHPPERLGFSRDRFMKHYNAATDLLYRISQADGRSERLIAAHELDALLTIGDIVNQRMR